MKIIGLLGGMSWESTVTYYRIINEYVQKQLGGVHSAKMVITSGDFAELAAMQERGDWDQAAAWLTEQAQALKAAGADFMIIGANTMHKVAPQLQAAVDLPLLHIADATIAELQKANITRVGLLGTKYTLTQAFYKDRIAAAGINVLLPDAAGIETVNKIIYDELCAGKILPASKQILLKEITKMQAQGAQGIILGCTELDLQVKPEDTQLPVFDTTEIHALAAAARALAD
ncbi:aspartate/glutamate racemase family protein [Lacticaseibacillus zhaodongensis]|uniref:aspartate/glutamate racemase family protein n=1 Tax=Lacticaseibacillus zhaodongensis TaxID=2668065 RepID=UPI0012D31AD9|nr:aspartate/glutamate racemase family protein [Lacticaseibacillus zhaodongensis]